MKAFDYIPLYSYEDYKLWQGDWELIHGYPHAMSPSPFRKHQLIISKINNHFSRLFEKNSDCKDCEVYFELDWIINDTNIVRPDLMVVCGDFKDDFLRFPPVLIVEVLSKSTTMKDRNIKYKLYEGQRVKYYVMVNPENNETEIFELVNDSYILQSVCPDFNLHQKCILNFDIPAFIANLNL